MYGSNDHQFAFSTNCEVVLKQSKHAPGLGNKKIDSNDLSRVLKSHIVQHNFDFECFDSVIQNALYHGTHTMAPRWYDGYVWPTSGFIEVQFSVLFVAIVNRYREFARHAHLQVTCFWLAFALSRGTCLYYNADGHN